MHFFQDTFREIWMALPMYVLMFQPPLVLRFPTPLLTSLSNIHHFLISAPQLEVNAMYLDALY